MHAPSDYSPAARAFWDRIFETSMEQYTQIPQYYERDAALTARIATLTVFPGGRKRGRCAGLRRMPAPGPLDYLGTFQGVDGATPDGRIWSHTWAVSDRVELHWSQNLSALVAIPGARIGECRLPPTQNGDLLQRVWAKGRRARCSGPAKFDLPALPECNAGIAVAYRSDKFTHGRTKDYIHHFDAPGVRVWLGRAGRKGPAVFIRGGRLRIETHGISG